MILVTGGTGLVGAHLLLKLVSEGKTVRAIHRKDNLEKVRQTFAYYHPNVEAQKLFDKIEWKKADVLDIPALTDAFQDVDYVYHCAAVVSFNASDAKKMRKINIEGTANVVNLGIAFQIKKLCHVSSIATLNAETPSAEITEASAWNPEKNHSEYAISKYGAEIEVWRGTQENLRAVIVNPGVIIGPGNWDSGSGQIFSKIENGLRFYFSKTTGFVGVNDVVNAMYDLMLSDIKNEQFVLVSENKNFSEILPKVAENLNKPAPSKQLKPWMVKIGWILQKTGSFFGKKQQLTKHSAKDLFEDAYYSSQKIEQLLNFRFEPVEESIKRTAEIFKNKKSREA